MLAGDPNPTAQPSIDATRGYLDDALHDAAVCLVTSAWGDRHAAATVTFFAESSHVPPLLRVSLAHGSFTRDLVRRSGRFGVSVLARGQEELAMACGTVSGRDGAKLQRLGVRYVMGTFGVPILPDCLTTSECLVVDALELPDHTLFVGELVTSHRQSVTSYNDVLLVSDLLRHLGRAG